MSNSRNARAAAGVVALVWLTLAAPAVSDERCGGTYVIAPGDTLAKVAARCGSTVEALMRANPDIASPARIAAGWRLTVPGGGAEAASAEVGGPVALTGRIVNGRRCAMIETADGESYGLVSREVAFVSGAVVEVTGQVVNDPSCTGPRTLLVDELVGAEPT